MSTFDAIVPGICPARSQVAVPTAAFEVLGYLCVVGLGHSVFCLAGLARTGRLCSPSCLLASLIVLAWNRFDQGRHPCFLFLCTLMFFQGGGLLAYCLGADNDPLQVQIYDAQPLLHFAG